MKTNPLPMLIMPPSQIARCDRSRHEDDSNVFLKIGKFGQRVSEGTARTFPAPPPEGRDMVRAFDAPAAKHKQHETGTRTLHRRTAHAP